MVRVLTSSVVDHWWCNGSCAHLECGRSLVVQWLVCSPRVW